jgi:hypothetical protein
MRRAGNFNPEWGYLAPVPGFLRTARIVVVATAVGATAGAAVVFSLVDRPVAEESVAARTLAPSAASTLSSAVPAQVQARVQARVQAQVQAKPSSPHPQAQAPAPNGSGQSVQQPPASARLESPAAAESSSSSTSTRPASIAALAESPVAIAAPAVAADSIIADGNPAQKKPIKKRVWHNPAPREQAYNRSPLALLRSLRVTGASRQQWGDY